MNNSVRIIFNECKITYNINQSLAVKAGHFHNHLEGYHEQIHRTTRFVEQFRKRLH